MCMFLVILYFAIETPHSGDYFNLPSLNIRESVDDISDKSQRENHRPEQPHLIATWS